MTLREILEMYEIEMINTIITNSTNEKKYIRKTFLGGDEMEAYFDLSFRDPSLINEDVLPIVQYFINGNNPPMEPNEAELGGMGDYALPYVDGICFHNPYNGEITQTIPLEHFKIIAEAWRDFLLLEPLSGTETSK